MIFRKSKKVSETLPASAYSSTNGPKEERSDGQNSQALAREEASTKDLAQQDLLPSETRRAPPPSALGGAASGLAAKDSNTLFLEILILAMKAKETKELSLSDLEWFLLPPVRYNQAFVAAAKSSEGAKPVPVGFLLWAKVSPDVDGCLREEHSALPRLAPEEWQSGSIPWLIAAARRPEIVRAMLTRVVKEDLQDQTIKLRLLNADGCFTVKEVKVRPGSEMSSEMTAVRTL